MGQYYATPQADHAASLAEQDGTHGTRVLATFSPAAPAPSASEPAATTTPRRRGRPATPGAKATPKSESPKTPGKRAGSTPKSAKKTPKSTKSSPAKSSGKSDESIVAIAEPADLRTCKVAELRGLAAENGVKQTGTKYELIGRLLSLFDAETLTEDALSTFTVTQLRTMGKGINASQRATSRAQLLHALIAHARSEVPSPRTSTPQPSRRKRSASTAQLPQTERATRKRARTDKKQ